MSAAPGDRARPPGLVEAPGVGALHLPEGDVHVLVVDVDGARCAHRAAQMRYEPAHHSILDHATRYLSYHKIIHHELNESKKHQFLRRNFLF